MHRFALVAALTGLCIFPIRGSAQSATVQLCVANMQVSGSNNTMSGGQDQLIKALNKEKPDKALSIQNVPIPPAMPDDALAAAKQKSCDYLVTTDLTEKRTEQNVVSVGGTGRINMQTNYITTAYKLTKVSDGSELSSGSAKASGEGADPNPIIGQAMKKVADKVAEAIRKAGPVAK